MRGDINLLPRKSSGEKTKLATGFIVAMIILIVICTILFMYIPNMEKRSVKKEIEAKQAELAEQTATIGEYSQLNEEFIILKEKNTIFNNIIGENLAFSGILEGFEPITPTSIVLDELTYIGGILNIKGTTPSSLELSQYMVNLRKLDNVILVSLTSMELEPEESEEEDITTELYTFDLSVLFYEDLEEEVEEDIKSQEEITDENDSEEVITDEGVQ